MSEKEKIETGSNNTNAENPAQAVPQKPPAQPRMAVKLEEQARQKIRAESAKRREFAMGKKRHNDGK